MSARELVRCDAGTRGRGDAALRRRGESGFALLLVFAMAAIAAVMLYMELPRVAFESQRNQEQLLIERGEQYKRAIQLYFRKFKSYPATLEQLENTNNVRFLRRRYADPLTGKDEWRLIHVGPGGIFTDSITRKPKNADKNSDKKDENSNSLVTEGLAMGSTLADAQPAVGGPRRRPSEGGQARPAADGSGAAFAGGQQEAQPPGLEQPADQTGDPTQQALGQPQTTAPGGPQAPVSPFPGATANPNNPSAPQYGTTQPPANPALVGQQDPNGNQPPAGSQAADLINNLLRRPRAFPGGVPGGVDGAPGGVDGASGGVGGVGGGRPQIGAGSIAGVASKVEKRSIKIYNDRDKYNEWEFIYDFAQDRTGAGRMAGGMGAGDPRLTQQAGPAGFGGQTGFGQAGATGAFGSPNAQPSSTGAGVGTGADFGGNVGPGFGQPQQPTAPQRQPFPQPVQQPVQQPVPQPGPIPPPEPPPPEEGQTDNPPQ